MKPKAVDRRSFSNGNGPTNSGPGQYDDTLSGWPLNLSHWWHWA
jgi:hypothetical protein